MSGFKKRKMQRHMMKKTIYNIMKKYVPRGAHVLGTYGIKDRGEDEMLFSEKQWLKYIRQYKDKETKRNIYEFELVNYNPGW